MKSQRLGVSGRRWGRSCGLLLACAVSLTGFPGASVFSSSAIAQDTAPAKPKRPVRTQPKPATPDVVPDTTPLPADEEPTPAQPGKAAPTSAKPATTAPRDDSVVKRPAPIVGPYLKKTDTKNWELRVNIRLNSDRPDEVTSAPGTSPTGKPAYVPKITPFKTTSIAVVFPAVEWTGSSECAVKSIGGRLRIDDQLVAENTRLMDGLYHSGVFLVRLDTGEDAKERSTREVSVDYTIPVSCSKTDYDETAAEKLDWPKGPWPVSAASTLTPQLYIDIGVDDDGIPREFSDEAKKEVDDLIDRALKFAKAKDAHSLHPARLAKVLTRQIWEEIQISGSGEVARERTGEFAGLDVQPPMSTIQNKRGSEHDIVALAAAVFRRAGLPTRTVIGYDVLEKEDKFLKDKSGPKRVRSWIEFCVYDEAKNTINWVPVDIGRLKKSSSRPRDLDRPWKYFGSHDELFAVVPFALHFHPPTDVVAYRAPGFWGWYVKPSAPHHALQAIRFDVVSSSRRGDDKDKNDKDDKDNKPPARRGT